MASTQPAELERTFRKVAQREPITDDEREMLFEAVDDTPADEEGGVVLSPEDEDELKRVIAENDEDERAGRGIPWERFVAERKTRRGG